MTIRVALHHRTSYRFDRLVNRSPRDPPASGAAHPDAGPRLFAEHRPGRAFPQLAAGPVRQLGRARGLSRARLGGRDHGRPHRRHDGHQSVRLFRRALRRKLPIHLRAGAGEGIDSVPGNGVERGAARGMGRALSQIDPARREHRQPAGAAQPGAQVADRIPRADGAGRPDAGADAYAVQRLVPRFGLAAGADPAPSGSRGALRLRLSDPARRRREVARWTERDRARFHRSARLGRGLPAGCGLDRLRSDLGPSGRRRAYSAGVHRRPGQCGARHRRDRPVHRELRRDHERYAHARGPARHQAVQRRAMGGHRCAWTEGRRRSRAPWTCA